jgi:hypothetical protein
MARKQKTEARITPEEATRGIYVDCEGFKEKSPSLIGVLIEDQFEQVAFDPELRLAAEAKGRRVSSFPSEAARIARLAKDEDRVVVAYSQVERQLFSDYARVDLGRRYRDARKIAKYWKNVCHYDGPIAGRGLKDFFDFIGYEVTGSPGKQKTTKRLRALLEMLPRKGSYEALTPTKKAQWANLLTYNEHDCRGMKELVMRASRELEARG